MFQNHYLSLAAAATILLLCGCGDVLTFQSDESAWQQARSEAAENKAHQRLEAAETQYKQALELAGKLESTAPDHLATSYMDLGKLYCDEHKYAEATLALQQACDRFAAIKPPKDSSEMYWRLIKLNRAKAIEVLAKLYADAGENARAEALYKDALSIRTYGLGAIGLIENLKSGYADLLDKEGRHKEATALRAQSGYSPIDD